MTIYKSGMQNTISTHTHRHKHMSLAQTVTVHCLFCKISFRILSIYRTYGTDMAKSFLILTLMLSYVVKKKKKCNDHHCFLITHESPVIQ